MEKKREIKFRSWIPLIGHSEEYPKVGSMACWDLLRAGRCVQVVDGLEFGTVMQFTGLLDKNGKEIYEGDVIRDQSGNIWEVYFDMGQFLEKNNVVCNTIISLYEEPIKEVIGNIYENPELLSNIKEE